MGAGKDVNGIDFCVHCQSGVYFLNGFHDVLRFEVGALLKETLDDILVVCMVCAQEFHNIHTDSLSSIDILDPIAFLTADMW